ncbi:hypothetical protein OKW46_002116 [Paraburkholderia sp. WSM4179]|nr:hypothetical protein [Paraburkholderia sp. WSM4179]
MPLSPEQTDPVAIANELERRKRLALSTRLQIVGKMSAVLAISSLLLSACVPLAPFPPPPPPPPPVVPLLVPLAPGPGPAHF